MLPGGFNDVLNYPFTGDEGPEREESRRYEASSDQIRTGNFQGDYEGIENPARFEGVQVYDEYPEPSGLHGQVAASSGK